MLNKIDKIDNNKKWFLESYKKSHNQLLLLRNIINIIEGYENCFDFSLDCIHSNGTEYLNIWNKLIVNPQPPAWGDTLKAMIGR